MKNSTFDVFTVAITTWILTTKDIVLLFHNERRYHSVITQKVKELFTVDSIYRIDRVSVIWLGIFIVVANTRCRVSRHVSKIMFNRPICQNQSKIILCN